MTDESTADATEEAIRRRPGRKSKDQIEAERQAEDERINALVDQRVQAVFAQLQAQVEAGQSAAAAPAATSGDSGVSQILSDLVVNLKKLADPQSQKRIFSPEEMKRMEDAREEMTRLIVEANARGDMPAYALKAKVYLAEMKIEPQRLDPRTNKMVAQEINWPRVPNEAMVPLNAVAKKIHDAFMRSIGGASINKNTNSQFVINGKQVLRQAPTEPDQMGHTGAPDLREAAWAPEPVDYTKPINVLGTVAAPVVPTQGARFENVNAPSGRQ